MRSWLYNTLVALRAIPPPPATWESFFGESRSLLAGVAIDESNALNYSPVWCGVSTLSRDVAKLPLQLWRHTTDGGKTPFKTHKLYRILHDEPNPEMSSFKFRETMQALCLLYGNAYAEIVRDGVGRPVGMYPIVPTRVSPMRTDTGRLFYRVMNARGSQTDVAAGNMLHLSSLSTDGILGHGIVMHARESFGLGVAAEQFGASFFGNGTTFGGVVEVPGSLKGPEGEQTKESVRKTIEAVHAGVARAHKILVLGAGSKFTERGTKPNEAQFTETRKFQINEVARWLTMPPHKLGDLENAHFTNIEEQELQYYVGTVSGWLEMWEQELTRKLVSPLEYSQQTIEHNLDGVMRGNSTQRAEFYSKMHAIGAYSINDILRKENMNPIGPSGDMHLVPLNMVPAERYHEWIDVTLAAKKAPPPPLALPPKDETEAAAEAERMLALVAEIRSATLRSEEHIARAVAAEAKAAQDAEHAAGWQATADAQRADALAAIEAQRLAEAALADLQQAHDAAVHWRADADARAAEMVRLAAEIEGVRAATAQDAADAADEARRAKVELADLQQAHALMVQRAADLEAQTTALAGVVPDLARAEVRATTVEQQVAAVEAALAAKKAEERDRLSRVVAAHRALIVDVVTRVLRPEVDRARRRQVTPDALRKWAEAFYQTHRDVCAEAFYPAVVTHLAWKRSDEDPRVVARALATSHCESSERDLDAVVTRSEPEEFHAALEAVLVRWERERPGAVADTLLADEVQYIGGLT